MEVQPVQALFENCSDTIILTDDQGRVTFASSNVSRLLGYSSEELLNKRVAEFAHPDDRVTANQIFHKLRLHPSQPVPFTFRARHRNQSWCQLEGCCSNHLQNRQVQALIITCREQRESRGAAEAHSANDGLATALIITSPDSILITDEESRILEFNPAAERLLGFRRDAVLGRNVVDLLLPGPGPDVPRNTLVQLLASSGEQPGGQSLQLAAKRNDGSEIRLGITLGRVTGKPPRLVLFIRDITEREQVHALLQESENRFQAYMDNCPIQAFMKDADGRLLFINRAFIQAFGFQNRDWYGKTDFELWPEETARILRANDLAILESGQPRAVEEKVRHASGEHLWLTYKFPFRDRHGRCYLAGMGIDLTERHEQEIALRESEERYRTLVEMAQDAILILEGEAIRYCNPAGLKLLRAPSPEALLGLPIGPRFHPDEQAIAAARRQQIRATGQPIPPREFRVRCLDNEYIVVESSGTACLFQGKPALQVIFRDVRERKRTEQALRDSEALYGSLINNLPVNLFRKDLEGRFTFANDRCCALLGKPLAQVLGKKDEDL